MTASNANIFVGPTGQLPVVNSQGQIYEEVQVATAAQTLFTLTTFQYTVGTKTIIVLKNGIELRRAVDYTETSATQVTLAAGAAAGDKLTFRAYAISVILAPLQNNGVIPAGLINQVLAKKSASDYDLQWLSFSSLPSLLDQPRTNVASAPTVDLTGVTTTRNIQITGTTQIDGFAISSGQLYAVRFAAALTLSNNAAIITQAGSAISVQAGDTCLIRATADNIVEVLCYSRANANLVPRSNVRQTVQAGPITSGAATPGGAIGATVVTNTNINAANPWVVSAAGGESADRIGISTANLSYTGLNVNGTMYLFNTIDSQGNITTSTSSLAPTYQESGARSTANGQFTFNISEMYATVGNGAAANQSYTVCVGEVTVAANVVNAITWYQYNGRYDSGWTNTPLSGAGNQMGATHKLGITPENFDFVIENTVLDLGWAAGTRFKSNSLWTNDGGVRTILAVLASRTGFGVQIGSTGGIAVMNSGGAGANIAYANWKWKFIGSRGWGGA